jgi:Nitroreductase family
VANTPRTADLRGILCIAAPSWIGAEPADLRTQDSCQTPTHACRKADVCLPYPGPMEFADVIRKRRMVRAYADESVAPDAVERILAAANRAPSAGFSQGYALMTLQGPEQLGPFWELTSGIQH